LYFLILFAKYFSIECQLYEDSNFAGVFQQMCLPYPKLSLHRVNAPYIFVRLITEKLGVTMSLAMG
jgi:hypothetical protein